MASDPAVLFYTSDFLSGTELFTYDQKGRYIHLLCAQHQNGHLPKDYMLKIIESEESIIWSKFIKDDRGLFFNEKMDNEKERRKKFCESRRLNVSHRYESTYEPTYVGDMKPHMETVTETVTNNKIFRKPTLEQVKKYCLEIGTKVDPELFFHNYESTNWVKANGQKVKNWKSTIRTWEKRHIEKEAQKPKAPDHNKRYLETQKYLRELEESP
jgi:hypothetical protein